MGYIPSRILNTRHERRNTALFDMNNQLGNILY